MKVSAYVLLLLTLGLAGCNTIAGMGQDIESGGEKIQETSDDVKKKM